MFGLLLIGCAPLFLLADDEAAKDLKQLQGTWSVVSFEGLRKKLTDEELKQMKVVIKDDTMALQLGKSEEGGAITIVPSKMPKALDLTATGSTDRSHFIYEITGDNLKLCWRKDSGKRPTKFSTEDADGLMILKRAK